MAGYYNSMDFVIDFSVLFPSVMIGYSFLMAFLGIVKLIDSKKNLNNEDNDDKQGLYERMGEYKTNYNIKPDEYYIVRMDGRNFRRITNKFEKPYDEKFASIMLNTATDLYKHFNPVIAHVQNDEINLVFDNKNYLFKGNYDKLMSIIPSHASSCFTQNMIREIGECDNNISFEGEIFKFTEDEKYEMINYLYWRSVADGYINSVAMYANHYFLAEDLIGVSTPSRIKMMELINEPFYFDNLSNHNKYGWFIKNECVNYETVDASDNAISFVRNEPVAKSFRIEYSSDLQDELFGYAWNPDNNDNREIKN